MALSQKHRSVLSDHFSPLVGEDVAEALMAEFPGREGDELVTKDFLRAEISSALLRHTSVVLGAMALATTIILAAD